MRIAALLAFLLWPFSAVAEQQHYFILFTTDSTPYQPTKAHTFAALVSVNVMPGEEARDPAVTSMSWLPATMKVRGLAMRSETGRNVPLHETLQFYADSRICMWGPYRVRSDFAETFKARVATVESSFGYKGACWLSPMHVCDCARSIEEMIDPHRRYIGVFGYGAAAGSYIVRKFAPYLVEPECPQYWVASLIGLGQYRLVLRDFGDYTSKYQQMGTYFRR